MNSATSTLQRFFPGQAAETSGDVLLSMEASVEHLDQDSLLKLCAELLAEGEDPDSDLLRVIDRRLAELG